MGSFIGFIPTPIEQIDGFFELAALSESDVIYDLGSGDGRLLLAALEKGAKKGVGIELNPVLVREAMEIAKSRGLQDRITLIEADVINVNLSDASMVLCYLSIRASTILKQKFESELKPGARVIMEMYPVPGWRPARTIIKGRKRFYLYDMPPDICVEDTAGDPLLDYLNSTYI